MKKKTSFTLSEESHSALGRIATNLGVSRTKALEFMIREKEMVVGTSSWLHARTQPLTKDQIASIVAEVLPMLRESRVGQHDSI